MQVSQDFEIPVLDEATRALPESVASTKALYAMALDDSDDPISTFQTVKTELSTQGYSALMESAEQKWIKEQDEFGKEYFSKLIEDPNVDINTKRNALSLYSTSGYISKSLRDKYLEEVATIPAGKRVVDNIALDEMLKSFEDRKQANEVASVQEDINDSELGVKDWAKGLGIVGATVISSIPASLWGAAQAIWNRDLITGEEVTTELLQNWSPKPNDPASQAAVDKILDKLSFLEIPYEKAVSYTLKNTGNEQLAIASGLATEFVTGAAAFKALRSVGKVAVDKGVPTFKKSSPLKETIIANPKVGGDIAAASIKDVSGQIGGAVGEDAGTIISNLVLPKPFKTEKIDNNPSIHTRLAEDLKELDAKFIKELEDSRWDPNLYDADTRRADYETILKTTREVDSPTYMPANSVLTPSNLGVYSGKATFGRDTDLFFHSRNDVIRAYDSLKSYVDNIPEELNTRVSIVDKLTGTKYTPEELMKDPKFKSGLEKVEDIPTKTDSGIPINVGKTNKTRTDGTYIPAVLRKDKNNKPTSIDIDIDYIKSTFADKPWTKPKVEGVTPLVESTFKTPEEWAKFVYLHEEAHIDYPNTNNALSKAEYENLVNQKALEKFNTTKNDSWNAQPLSSKQFAVELEWNREYDDLDVLIFGDDAISAELHFGVDVSGLARSSLSQWVFGGVGVFPKWFESSGARAAPKAAKQAATMINTIKKKIASTPFRKELNDLISIAEERGIESFTLTQLQNKFPKLSKKDVESLFETHTYWRRVNHYNHALINLTYRNNLLSEGFTSGLWINGKYKGAVNSNVKFDSFETTPKTVWDFEKEIPIELTLDRSKDIAFDVSGKQVVMLKKAYSPDDGVYYQYALAGDTKTKVDMLPDTVVPRLPGYSPIKTTAAWYIDVIPTSAEINGMLVSDPVRLRNLTRTIAAGITKQDIKKLEVEIKAKYPTSVVQARQDKDISFNRIMADQEANQEILRNALERGERLPTLNGPAPIEDRLTSLVKSVQTLTRQNSMQAYSQATEKAFVRDFKQFLPNEQFPVNRTDINPLPNMSPEETIQYQNALSIWDQYAKVKSFGTMGDRAWSNVLNTIADKLEDFKVTYKAGPVIREVAKKGNILANYPRQLASTLYISLNPLRQWIVQPAQLLELWAISPQTAIQRFADLSGIRLALAAKSDLFKNSSIDFYEASRSLAPTMDKVEFDKTVKAIEQSGLLESVDLNMLVHGIFNDIDKPLIESPWEKSMGALTAIPKGVTRLSRQVGFDFAELNNRMGIWLVMKDKWKESNPSKDWTSKEAIEEISYNEWRWSGSMSRAGALPYQEGAFSVLMQFAAITQKMTMNLIQKNGLLSPQEKARLVAARAVLYGAKWGIPGGALAYYFIDRSEDEEVQKYGDTLKRGLVDRTMSSLFNALSGSDQADLLVSRGMAPYSESTTGIPYVEVIGEFAKLWDGKDATNPRLPALGALGSVNEAIGRMRSWFVTKDVTNEDVFKRTMMEAFSVASSMNNFTKAQLMLSMKEKVTKNGNKLGLDFTASEAYAQMLGVGTWKEEELWAGITATMDRKDRIEQMATNIHKWMEYQQSTMKSDDPVQRFDMLTSFVTMLQDDKNWTDQDTTELYQLTIEKMKRVSKDTNSSLLEAYIKAHSDKNSEELVRAKNALATNPKNKELLDILDGKGNP